MRFFTSDQHFNHANIIKYSSRPFNSVKEMNDTMIMNWNKVVGKADTVFCVGDFSLSVANLDKILAELNGTKVLIYGNHDRCWRQESYVEKYKKWGFTEVLLETLISIASKEVFVTHLPYRSAS